jgi:hypothetical protein
MTYNQNRSYSDKSLPEAKKHIANFIKEKLNNRDLTEYVVETSFYQDTTESIDLHFKLPNIKVSHRARKKDGNIRDITIKTKSIYDKPCEIDKLIELSKSNKDPWFYFYCYFDDETNKITRYIIYDLGKLIQTKEFQDKSIFEYSADKINTKDGGSHFNCITVQKLIDMDIMCVDCSKHHE